MGIRCANHVTPLYPQKLALTSPTGGGRSVGMVRSRTKATEFIYIYIYIYIEYKKCVLTSSTTYVRNISHYRKNSAIQDKKLHTDLHVKYPQFLSDFNETLIFSTDFRKILTRKIL